MEKNSIKRFRLSILIGVSALSLVAFTVAKDELFLISKNLDIFTAVYRQVSVNYVDETNPDKLIKTAVDAMLSDLDPYTEYVQEADMDDYRLKYVDTRYGGIGASVFTREDKVFIGEPFAGLPAEKGGLRAGDELVSVNGTVVSGKTTNEVGQLLKGPEKSSVLLEIRRPHSGAVEEIVVTRTDIRQPNVSFSTVWDGDIGYIRLDKFLSQAAEEVKTSLLDLQHQHKLKGLVLDLRNNGGGIMQEAVRIVNLFVDKDEVVVTQKGKNASKTYSYRTSAEPVAKDLPLVVLVNGRSASAAEIVAGALQDMDRAVIVGEKSFGKGLVQQAFNIPYNNLVKVTVAKYYTPSGRCIQELDFVHKDINGNALKLPDSLINEYTTVSGRRVYDGSGISPDVVVETPFRSRITNTLLRRFLVFDFATQFVLENDRVADARKFELTESQYEAFIAFLQDKDYNYNTRSEEMLSQLKLLAVEEKKSNEILSELKALETKMFISKQQDLDTHRDEIKRTIANEIVARYYYQDGRIENTIKGDPQFQEAIKLLSGEQRDYSAILAGEGTYRWIGKPEALLATVDTEN